jgi:endonuclease/exonuclease/phosphatase family metal-dependent hydrolase
MAVTILISILLLVFFQLLTDFIHFIYAFGLMGTSIPPEIVSVLFLFTPLILLFKRKRFSRVVLLLLGLLVLLTRGIEPLLESKARMLVSGLGVGGFLLFLPALIGFQSDQKEGPSWSSLALSLIGVISFSTLFRSWGSGLDLSTKGSFQVLGWVYVLIGSYLLITTFRDQPLIADKSVKTGFGHLTLQCIGFTSVLALVYFAFLAPNLMVRWTESSYLLITSLLTISWLAIAVMLTFSPGILNRLKPAVVVVWNLIFTLALLGTILPFQINFPLDPTFYPLSESSTAPWTLVPLILTLLLSPILAVDFGFFYQAVRDSKPTSRELGASFGLAALFLLVMIFAHVFTTVYDYIPVVGPFFRDKFWLVYLTLGVVLTAAAAGIPRKGGQLRTEQEVNSPIWFWILTAATIGSVMGVIFLTPNPRPVFDDPSSLKILTYNIQQGFNANGQWNPDGQLDLIRSFDPDIIGLQESDTNRIAGGNADLVRYFANQLNMYSYYGPKVVTGTFGIALLSKYPLVDPQTFYMMSTGEQTASITAKIQVGKEWYTILVTHLGNGGPIQQQKNLLREIEGKENLIAMGDFNFQPDTEQYQLTTDTLKDSWLDRWPEDVDDHGIRVENRIDHIFLSPEIPVIDARFWVGPESDHPALFVEVKH